MIYSWKLHWNVYYLSFIFAYTFQKYKGIAIKKSLNELETYSFSDETVLNMTSGDR